MAPVAVYRIEHRTKHATKNGLKDVFLGPFWQCLGLNSSLAMPHPFDDGITIFGNYDIFGFTGNQRLFHWFGEDAPVLLKNDYVVRVYLLPVVAVSFGGEQVSFDSQAKISGSEEISITNDEICAMI